MIDDADDGNTVFYRYYTDAQRREEPARSNTGLFFFRGRRGAPFAVISPGGGFSYVASVHEGFPHAAAISSKGLNAFVLRYRAGYGGTVATQDLAAALAYTGHSDYSSDEPPTFVVVGEQDGIAPPAVMKRRVEALRRSGTEVEYHRYENLGHGFGLGTGTSAEGWVFEAIRFWQTSIRRLPSRPRR
jgi:acetyl esterase/lipase